MVRLGAFVKTSSTTYSHENSEPGTPHHPAIEGVWDALTHQQTRRVGTWAWYRRYCNCYLDGPGYTADRPQPVGEPTKEHTDKTASKNCKREKCIDIRTTLARYALFFRESTMDQSIG